MGRSSKQDLQREIMCHLRAGYTTEDEAINARELGELYNLTKREIRMVVTALRKEGYPICSSNNGYWYGKNEKDVDKTVKRLEAQIANMQEAVDGLLKGGTR